MTFPSVAAALWNWTTPTRFIVMQEDISNYEVSETPVDVVEFRAVLEAISPRALSIKPENQRRWKWWTVLTTFKMEAGTLIRDHQGLYYRIMSINDWSQAGYYSYEAAQAPSVGQPPPVAPV